MAQYPAGTQVAEDLFLALNASNSDTVAVSPPPRRRRRNKPTLNCHSCVERKVKCDRGRPSCQACLRRDIDCRYNHPAASLARVGSSSPHQSKAVAVASDDPTNGQPKDLNPSLVERPNSTLSTKGFHPFAKDDENCRGVTGLLDLVPARAEADHLVAKFFRHVDPIYPVVSSEDFISSYDYFWNSQIPEKKRFNPRKLALHLAVYACGSLSSHSLRWSEHSTAVEGLLSACHQALCISSYLSEPDVCTVQTLILVSHALFASGRVVDAWTFAGITQRQVHSLQLNRPPNIAAPDASEDEKQLRCRLWQATMLQDSILSLSLKLPPTTLYHDIRPSSLPPDPLQTKNGHLDRMTNGLDSSIDIPYLRTTWELATLMQVQVCVATAFKRPLFKSTEDKAQGILRFLDLYASSPHPFSSTDAARFDHLDPRVLRQLVFFNVHFFSTLTLLYMAEDDTTGTTCDAMGALTAAYEGLAAYFAHARFLSYEPPLSWDSVQATSFLLAHCVGTILSRPTLVDEYPPNDSRLTLAKSALDRYYDILSRSSPTPNIEKIRQECWSEIQGLRDKIKI